MASEKLDRNITTFKLNQRRQWGTIGTSQGLLCTNFGGTERNRHKLFTFQLSECRQVPGKGGAESSSKWLKTWMWLKNIFLTFCYRRVKNKKTTLKSCHKNRCRAPTNITASQSTSSHQKLASQKTAIKRHPVLVVTVVVVNSLFKARKKSK